jgi:hypothetical protein
MINRRTLECDACGTRTITRTAIGHGDKQTLAFPCPGCGVGIVFRMNLDQKVPSFEYEDKPDNAHWFPGKEEGAKFEATFDVDLLVPREDVVYEHVPGGYRFSPFMQASQRFASWDAWAQDEGTRKLWLTERRPIVQRISTHFERKNWALFSKEIRKLDPDIAIESQAERFRAETLASRQLLELFIFQPHLKLIPRIEQRVALATSIAADLTMKDLFGELQRSGRLLEWWRQIRSVRSAFHAAYPYYHVMLQPLYWKDRTDVVDGYVVSNKGFPVLKDLYISAFETLARLSVIAVGLEAVIHYRELKLPTRKGHLSILDYEALANANKPDYLDRFPIADIFHDFLDTGIRNGIGHNSARYDAVDDTIVLVRSKDQELKSERIAYTEFCRKVVSMVSRLFVVETYLNSAIAALNGHLEDE